MNKGTSTVRERKLLGMQLSDYGGAEFRHLRSTELKNCKQGIEKLPKSEEAKMLTRLLMLNIGEISWKERKKMILGRLYIVKTSRVYE